MGKINKLYGMKTMKKTWLERTNRRTLLFLGSFFAWTFLVMPAVPGFAMSHCEDALDDDYYCEDLKQRQEEAKEKREQKEKEAMSGSGAKDAAPGKILMGEIPEVSGPKRTVAVGKFDSIGSFSAKYGSWDIGGGLGAMLASALVESGRFIVVERAHLQQVLSEQELKGAGVSNPATGPSTGKLIGVQLLIYGAVTEFGTDDKGGGFSIGGSGGGLGSLLSGALSQQSTSGKVAIDVRLVDTTSGQITETHRLVEAIESSGFDLSLGFKGISFGGNQFQKTPIGEASRRIITRAVQKIALEAQKTGWTGQVVDYDGKELYINAGQRAGIKRGDKFMIERVVKKLTDPVTQEVLLIRKKALGILEITGVEQKISFGPFKPLEVAAPKRGDFVAIIR